MKKVVFLVALAGLTLSGCVSLFKGMKDEVAFKTNPEGADVRLSNGLSGKTPCAFPMSRKSAVVVIIEKDGYHSHTGMLTPMLSGEGTFMGSLFDYGLGGAYDLQPNPYHVTLIPDLTEELKKLKEKNRD